jgi:hypothetical protein
MFPFGTEFRAPVMIVNKKVRRLQDEITVYQNLHTFPTAERQYNGEYHIPKINADNIG